MKNINLFFKSLCNWAILFLFVVLFVAVLYCPEVSVALMIGFFSYFIYVYTRLLLFKSSSPYISIVTLVTVIALLALLLAWPVVGQYVEYGTLFFEALFVVALWVAGFFNEKAKNRFVKNGKMIDSHLSVRFSEFFELMNRCKIVLSIHLIIVAVYHFCLPEYHTAGLTRFLFSQLNVYLLFFIITYKYIRVCLLRKEISAEKWLPIVNETGSVIGKIAYSVAMVTKKPFLFPVVRLALVYEDMLYLIGRDAQDLADPDKMDIPFEEYVRYDQTLEDAVAQILKGNTGFGETPANFAFKYIYKNQVTHRLTYLYVARISSPQQAGDMNLAGGKWWHEKQIEENLNKGVFSEFFEKEYEVLKNTILLAQRVVKQSPDGNKL